MRGILNSARGISDKDISPQAQARPAHQRASRISTASSSSPAIDIGKDTNGEDKNEIRVAVTPDHKDYAT